MQPTRVLSVPAEPGRANEDAVAVGPGVAVVVDGAGIPASLRAGCVHTVAWFARQVADTFRDHLQARTGSMQAALARTIIDVNGRHGGACELDRGSPSATVAAWRVGTTEVEGLVLCDASLIVVDSGGAAHELTDRRLDQIVSPALERLRADHRARGAVVRPADQRRARGAAAEPRRNRPGGFWCVQADPHAADEALCTTTPLAGVTGLVAVSDGASRAYQLLGTHTLDGFAAGCVAGDLDAVAGTVRSAETAQAGRLAAEALKLHDDLTVAATRR